MNPSERAVLDALALLGVATVQGVTLVCRNVAHGTVRTRLQQLTRRGLVGRWQVAVQTSPTRRRWCAVYRLTAAGKTTIGCAVLGRTATPGLVLMHTLDLVEQRPLRDEPEGPTGPTREENTWADFAGIPGDD